MVSWPRNILTERHNLLVRMCAHGIGHPDPDSLEWLNRIGVRDDGAHECDGCCGEGHSVPRRKAVTALQWDFFNDIPVVLQDAATKDVLMVQYMTEEGLRRTLEEGSMWLWSRSRNEFWMAGRQDRGYDLKALRANCMGDSLLAIVETGRTVPSATSAMRVASPSQCLVLLATSEGLSLGHRERTARGMGEIASRSLSPDAPRPRPYRTRRRPDRVRVREMLKEEE